MGCEGTTFEWHYLDDFFTAGPANAPTCANNLAIMQQTCSRANFELAREKVEGPTTKLTLLGIEIDTAAGELRMAKDRVDDIYHLMCVFNAASAASKKDVQSLTGKLNFVCIVVRPGRTFLRRLIDFAASLPDRNPGVFPLPAAVKADIAWWVSFIRGWNGVSLLRYLGWQPAPSLELYTDAAADGFGAYFQGKWLHGKFTDVEVLSGNIAWKELFALCVAVNTWAEHLAGKGILIHSDNTAVVAMIASGTSKHSPNMAILRSLFYICASNDFDVAAQHVPGVENVYADLLSRGAVSRFREVAINADEHPTAYKPVPYVF
jgi:hypothetical protein